MTMTDNPTPDEQEAALRHYEWSVRRGTQLRRRRRAARAAVGATALIVAIGLMLIVLPRGTHGATRVDVTASRATPPPSSTTSWTTTTSPPETPSTAPPSTPTTTSATSQGPTTAPEPTTEPTTTTQPPWSTYGPGTASLTFTGVLSGQLVNAVSYCHARPNASSDITVNGTLNGTPWVLFIQSYDGENGVWQVLTGEAGGATGMTGPGYASTADYPATVAGATDVDWTHGATLDVQLSSRPGQTPAGELTVQGTITCT